MSAYNPAVRVAHALERAAREAARHGLRLEMAPDGDKIRVIDPQSTSADQRDAEAWIKIHPPGSATR